MIKIFYISQDRQRYNTCGDYFKNEDGDTIIYATKYSNDDYSFLVALHELLEERLTSRLGITEKEITQFDLDYEEERKLGLHKKTDEAGFDKRSPYLLQHKFATKIEKMVCKEMGYDWKEYCKIIDGGE